MLGSVTCREKPIWSDSKNAFYKISLGGVCFLPGGPYEIQIIESNKGLFGLSNVNLIRPP